MSRSSSPYVAAPARYSPNKLSRRLDAIEDIAVPAASHMSSITEVFSNNSTAIVTILKSKQGGDIAAPLQQAMDALDALQRFQPFIGIAVVAFKAVIGMELKRRANDKRIGAVYFAILDMLSVLFELSNIKEIDRPDPNGGTVRGRLIASLTSAKEEIKTAANSIDKYSKTKFFVRVFKSTQWESELIAHTKTFGERKKDLKFALEIHTAVAVDKMQYQIAEMFKMLTKVLRNQSAKEDELKKEIDKNGGFDKVISRDDVLLTLSTKYEDKDMIDKTSSVVKSKDAQKTLDASLRRELQTSVHDDLKANQKLFDMKFDAQTAQLKEAMERSADRVISALSKGPYERVEDPDFRALWKDERWRSNVKARLLILSLHDYFTTPKDLPGPETDAEQDSHENLSKLTFIGSGHPEEWTLEYMGPLYITPLQDAIDDDSSGFVSINEINEFTREKPKDMSLPVWIAYWAAGWNIDSHVYEGKIRSLVKQMNEMKDAILDDNKASVETYLSSQFDYIEKLTTYSVDDDDWDLGQVVEAQRSKDEARITKNLGDIKYEIDSSASILAVCGPGRIDRHLMPLLYVLLKRHAQIIKLCDEYILDPEELEQATNSLNVVTDEVYKRIKNLKAGFTQQRLDLDRAFEFFGNGIYDDLYRYWYRDNDSDSESESEEESEYDEDASDNDANNGTDEGADAGESVAKDGSETSEHEPPKDDDANSEAKSDTGDRHHEAEAENGEDKENEAKSENGEDRENEAKSENGEDRENEAKSEDGEDRENEAKSEDAENKDNEAKSEDGEDRDDTAARSEGRDEAAGSERGDKATHSEAGSDEAARSEGGNGSGTDKPQETRPGTPATVAEILEPLSVQLLIFPAEKGKQEDIDALKEKVAAAQKKKATQKTKEAESAEDGEDQDTNKDAEVEEEPGKTLEERMKLVESDVKDILESLKEVLRRLPPKRR